MRRKKKVQPRFALVRRGYDVDSVEAYIALEREKADRAGLEQKERIRVLKAQCERLTEELAVYRDKEEQIKSALITAGEQAEKTTLDIKFRYAMELERLKLFRAKWTGAYEEIKQRYNFSKDALNMESVALSVKLELERFLAQDFSLDRGIPAEETEAAFKEEAERLGEEDSKVRELKEKLVQAAEKKDREARLASEKGRRKPCRKGRKRRSTPLLPRRFLWKRRSTPPKVWRRFADIWGSDADECVCGRMS